MNEKTINEQYAYIRTLLEEKRLKESRLLMLDNASSRYYHEVRRTPRSADLSNYGIKTILHILESFNDDLAVSGLLSDEKMDEVLRRHEDTLKFMFIRTWTKQ